MKWTNLRWRSLAKGAASFVHPGFRRSRHYVRGEPHTPEHYYQVFLRHFVRAARLMPNPEHYTMAELGPGDTIGAGLAALICGADRYIALDVENFAFTERNLATFDAIVELFRARQRPSNSGPFKDLFPPAVSEEFPVEVGQSLEWSMAPKRLAAVRADVEAVSGRFISVSVPWRIDSVAPSSVDWIMSHSVLEHVDEVERAYACFGLWARPGAVMSHLIDFSSHGLTREWNGHWSIGSFAWFLIRGKRNYLLNRLPMGEHLALVAQSGFQVAESIVCLGPPGVTPSKLSNRYRDLPETDTSTRMALLLCSRH